MNALQRRFALSICLSILGGCASYVHIVPAAHESVTYDQGTPIVTSVHNSSTVMLMPSQTSYEKGNRLGFYINVQNNSGSTVDIDMNNIHVTNGDDKALAVHTYESREKEIKRAQTWAAIGAGMAAAGDSMAASNAGYSTSHTSGTVNSYGTYGSSYGTYSGTTTTYDPGKAAAAQAQVNANNRQRMADMANATETAMSQAVLLLRRTTILPGKSHNAALLIDSPEKAPDSLKFAIAVGPEVHVINYAYQAVESDAGDEG